MSPIEKRKLLEQMPSPFPPMSGPAILPTFPPMSIPRPSPVKRPPIQYPRMPPQPAPQPPAGGIADLFAALQGGGNSSLYDQMAPPPAQAGQSPYADFQYLLDTPVDQRGFGYVPPPVTEDSVVGGGINPQLPRNNLGDDMVFPEMGQQLPNDVPIAVEMPHPELPVELQGLGVMVADPMSQLPPKPMAPAPYDDSGPIRGGRFGRRFSPLMGPDIQARIDEMKAKVEANKTGAVANPAATLSDEELLALRERIGNLNLGSFGNFNLGNFNTPEQSVEPMAATEGVAAVTPEVLMAQMPSNPFMGGFDREALMARIEAMQAQNGGNTLNTRAPAPATMPRNLPMMGVNSMFRGRR